jgi:putative addiction module component (TIGR02574 family)
MSMGLPLKQLESEALDLPPRERAELAHRLIASLDEDADEDPAEVERAWDEEIRHRLAELEAGTAELIPAEEVFAELRDRTRR